VTAFVEALRERLQRDPPARRFVKAVLDRHDRLGRLPATFIHACGDAEAESLRSLVPSDCMRAEEAGYVRVHLLALDERLRAQGAPGVLEAFASAAERRPRDLPRERRELREAIAAQIDAASSPQDPPALRGFLDNARALALRGRGEFLRVAGERGPAAAASELRLVASALRAIWSLEPGQTVRLENLSRRVSGSTKALAAGTGAFERLADALLAFDDEARAAAEAGGSQLSRRRLALEARGVLLHSLSAEVAVHGAFTYRLGDRIVDAPDAHAALGLPFKLTLAALREALPCACPAAEVTSVENEAAFHDYAEWSRRKGRSELVVYVGGQASFAAVALLRLIAASEGCPGRRFFHFGDLDRHGVLILRSMRRRTGLDIAPRFMDRATLERHLGAAQPLPRDEADRIAMLLAGSDAPQCGDDLLDALRVHGRWLEQETVAEALLREARV
jgi:hypothetical protein